MGVDRRAVERDTRFGGGRQARYEERRGEQRGEQYGFDLHVVPYIVTRAGSGLVLSIRVYHGISAKNAK